MDIVNEEHGKSARPRKKWSSLLALAYAGLFGPAIGQKLGQAFHAGSAGSAALQVGFGVLVMVAVWYFIGLGVRNTLYKFINKRFLVGIIGMFIGFFLYLAVFMIANPLASERTVDISSVRDFDDTYEISGTLYRHNGFKFRIRFPDNWTITKGDGPDVIVKSVDPNTGSSINISVVAMPGGGQLTINDLFKRDELIKSLEEAYESKIYMDQYKLSKFSNYNSVEVDYRLDYSHLGSTYPLRCWQVMFVKNGYLFTITCGSSVQYFDLTKPSFASSLNSFIPEDSFN